MRIQSEALVMNDFFLSIPSRIISRKVIRENFELSPVSRRFMKLRCRFTLGTTVEVFGFQFWVRFLAEPFFTDSLLKKSEGIDLFLLFRRLVT